MSYGIHIENSAGNTILDESLVNYVLIAQGSTIVSGSPGSIHFKNIEVSGSHVSKEGDLVFVSMGSDWNGGGVIVLPQAPNNSNSIQSQSFGSGTLNYRIYRKIEVSSSSTGYGLEIKRPSGNLLAYSSDYKVPRISSLITGTTPFSVDLSWTGVQPFICASVSIGVYRAQRISTTQQAYLYYTCVYSLTNNTYGVSDEIQIIGVPYSTHGISRAVKILVAKG